MSATLNADVLVKLSLIRTPEQRETKAGKPYTLARAREGIGDAARFWTLFAYAESARAEIDRLDVGDVLTVQGAFEVTIWDSKPSLKVNVDKVMALRPLPKAKASKPEPTTAAPRRGTRPIDLAKVAAAQRAWEAKQASGVTCNE